MKWLILAAILFVGCSPECTQYECKKEKAVLVREFVNECLVNTQSDIEECVHKASFVFFCEERLVPCARCTDVKLVFVD